MSTVPAKRKNTAVTADGAQYNKRHRPDNYGALMAMAPPPRPNVSNSTTINAKLEEEKCDTHEQVTPQKQDATAAPQAQKPNLWRWTKDGPGDNPATRDYKQRGFANGKKPRKATQGKPIKSDNQRGTSEGEQGLPVTAGGRGASDASTRDNDTGDGNSEDKISEPEAPGSPKDAPDTHFATFTPMGQGHKLIYKKPKGEKNHDEQKGKKQKNGNQKDLRYGQSSALDLDGDISDSGDTAEAMRYLRGVRFEANGLPITFRGTEPSDSRAIYDTAVGDTRGFYQDGAYVARPHMIGPIMPRGYTPSESFDEDEDYYEDEDRNVEHEGKNFIWVDPQVEYHNRVLLRFESHRDLMASTPTEEQQSSLDKSQHYTFPMPAKIVRKAVRHWLITFTDKPPHPAQVALMDSYCVLQLLDIIKRKLECFKDVNENTSAWILFLLARLCNIMPIYCDEASVVRELALRALMVRVTFTGEHIAELETKVPEFYEDDQEFFEHVDVNPKQDTKQDKKQDQAEGSAAPGAVPEEKKDEEDDGMADLRKQLEEKKKLLLKKEELLKSVAEMPRLMTKREVYGLPPRPGSGEDDDKPIEPVPVQDAVAPKATSANEVASEKEQVEPAANDQKVAAAVNDQEMDVVEDQHGTDKPTPSANTRATLHTILVIACDVFGQKDLSKYVEVWGEYDYPLPSTEQLEALAQIDDAQMDDSQMDDSQMDDSQMDDSQMDDAQMDEVQMDEEDGGLQLPPMLSPLISPLK